AGFNNISLSGVALAGNTQRALYFEKLNNATLTNNTITANTSSTVIDVNLKNGAYSGLDVEGGSITNSGTGAGLYIKGRDDGSNASKPGTLSGVTLHNLTVASGGTDLAFQNNVTLSPTTFSGDVFNGTGTGIAFDGSDGASTP